LLVLAGIGRQLEADAAAVRAGLAETARLRQQTEAELPDLAAAQQAQAHAATALDAEIGQARQKRRAAEDAAAEATRRAAAEAARAETLRAALSRLEAGRKAAEAAAAAHRQQVLASPDLGGAHGRLTAPVGGTITRGWGEPGESGPTNGVTYAAAPGARVVSPCSGRVVFASPFRSYGLLLIVDCGGGWHAVLAGLDRFDAQAGQAVREGEPVGVMPAWNPSAGGPRPGLYLELRKAGRPVNPTPLLHAKG
jgi:septal ring factor EnvC (AmiA/AmiB activator)